MQIKKKMVERKIAGETVLVPIGEAVLENNGLFMMTETGSFIWDILPECETENEILLKLLDEYDVDEAIARKDIDAFISQLREYDII